MKWYNKIGLSIFIMYIVFGIVFDAYYGEWEYGSAVIYWKAHYMMQGEPIYPPVLEKLSHPWIYMPISAILFAIQYHLSHGSQKLFAILGMFTFAASALITGFAATKLHKKDVTFLTAGAFVFPLMITWFGFLPRADSIAVLFLSIAVYYYIDNNDKMTLLFYALSFLSKQSYFLTIPLLYLFSKRYIDAIKAAMLPPFLYALCFFIPNFKENNYYYMIGSIEVLKHINIVLIAQLVIIAVLASGFLYYLFGLVKRKEFFYTAIVMTIIITYFMTKPGSTYYYMYPLLILYSLGAAKVSEIKKINLKFLLALTISFMIQIAYSSPIYDRAPAKKEVFEIIKDKKVFSGDTAFDYEHIDYFPYNVYAEMGLWDWSTITTRFSDQYYDYIVVSYIMFDEKTGVFYSERVPLKVYGYIISYYTDYTTIQKGTNVYFILTPMHH